MAASRAAITSRRVHLAECRADKAIPHIEIASRRRMHTPRGATPPVSDADATTMRDAIATTRATIASSHGTIAPIRIAIEAIRAQIAHLRAQAGDLRG
jgi:hypothetical protein